MGELFLESEPLPDAYETVAGAFEGACGPEIIKLFEPEGGELRKVYFPGILRLPLALEDSPTFWLTARQSASG